MSGWLMSIVGVICLSVLADILLPEGQTNKYIKGVFSVIALYVVISPLPKFLSDNFSLEKSLNMDAVVFEIDEGFLDGLSDNPFSSREAALERYLNKCGYAATVKYVGKIGNGAETDYINVILSSDELPPATEHKVISDSVKSLAADFTGEDAEDIRIIYG